MPTRSPPFWLLPLGLLLFGSGCLFKYHSTKVVGQNEARREVQFESVGARQAFSAKAFNDKSREAGAKSDVLTIPLLLWRSRMDVLSENAFYNAQVAACDRDGDGLITLSEAVAYRPPATYEELVAVSTVRASARRTNPTTSATAETGAKPNSAPVGPASYPSEPAEMRSVGGSTSN